MNRAEIIQSVARQAAHALGRDDFDVITAWIDRDLTQNPGQESIRLRYWAQGINPADIDLTENVSPPNTDDENGETAGHFGVNKWLLAAGAVALYFVIRK